nr:hypothetical protein [Tanacetum cinerariifolium]
MQTRSSSRLVSNPSSNPNPKGRNRRHSKQRIEDFNLEELSPPIVTMADQRTMAQLLQAPTKGYEDAIVVPAITADNFELKHGLLTLVQNKQFFRHDKEDRHAHVRYFNKITSTLKFPNDDLVSKFINQFFPLSKTINLRNEITNFQQRFDESFSETWDRFKDLLRAYPYHGFLELHQLDTFYNALNSKDQDSLNFAAGGNFLDKIPRECLAIIESKSKVRYLRNKPVVAKVSMNTSTFGISPDVAELKDMVKALLRDKKGQNQSPAPVKAVEESCVTYGGSHSYRNCPATDGNVYRDNIQEFISQASTVNYNQGNTSYRPPMMSNQIRPPGFPPIPNNQNVQLNQRNNQNRFILNQNRGNNFNQGPVYQPSVFQPPAYQAPAPQTQGVSKEDFSAYVKANDAVMRNKQTQGQNMQNQLTNLTDLITKFVNSNSASTSSSGILPSNTIANLRSDLKAITTRKATKDTVNPTNNGNIEDVQPPVVQSEPPILNSEFVTSPISEHVIAPVSAPKPNPKTSIPYPSRRNDERNREKANNQIEKFYQIFKDMSFEISFADALILMPKFASTLKALIGNKEKLSLPDLTPTCMTLELVDRSISRPVGVAEDVYVKVGSFHFLADFVVVDFDADLRVPLILRRSFLNIERALIDVFEGELTRRVGKEAFTFNLDQTSRYSGNYSDITAKRINVIDMACEEYSQEVLGDDKLLVIIAKDLSVEEKTALITVLKSHKRAIAWKLSDIKDHEKTTFTCAYGTFAYLRMPFRLCNAPGTFERCMMAIFHDMIEKTMEVFMDDFSIFENSFQSCLSHLERMLKRCEDTNLCLNWEKSHFMVKEGIVLGHKISKQGIEIDKAKVDVITKLPYPTTVKGIRSFLGHAGFYRRFIRLSKIARPMTRLLEKDTPFIFSQEYVEAFKTLKRKLIEAPILIASDWDMPFELMCDVSDYAIGAVLGQRQDKHFRPIHYASKTMTEAESNYTTTKKEMLVVVYAFDKFRSYLIMNKSILYTDHSALKYLFAKKDSKARLLRWVLLLQEFTFKVIDTKGAKNLAADHLSRLENPHQNVLDPKEINESFPLKTLNLISTRSNQSTPWFTDFANYHAGNFIVKGMSSSEGVYQARKSLKFLRLATMDLHENRASWSDKFDDALWAFRTAYKTPIGCTPYKLVYGKACHLPIELKHKAYWDLKHANFNLKTAGDHRKVQINELNELRDQAYENSLISKDKTKRLHDSKIKNCVFNIDDRVLLFNSRLKIFSGKLKSRWSGPFTISQVYPYGTIELS